MGAPCFADELVAEPLPEPGVDVPLAAPESFRPPCLPAAGFSVPVSDVPDDFPSPSLLPPPDSDPPDSDPPDSDPVAPAGAVSPAVAVFAPAPDLAFRLSFR